MALEIKEKLQENAIDLSVNPWVTLHHSGRGRYLKSNQDFQLMVGENGCKNGVTVCPLCENWQDYICELFGLIAKELKPAAIWLEDDWRLHNHDIKLGWGGCFCQLHLSRFAEIVGLEKLSRQELIENILKPGVPHEWRALWIDFCRDSLLEPAAKLAEKLKKVAPEVRLGQMTSYPDTHSIEGRDWELLSSTLSSNVPLLLRPHMAPYWEASALHSSPFMARMTIANFDSELEIYPEMENARLGLYSKSNACCVWQAKQAAMFGSRGITINHFDNMGNGCWPFEGMKWADKMKSARPQLDAVAELNLNDKNSLGVQVLFHPEIAKYLQVVDESDSMGVLFNDSTSWAKVFATLGIAYSFVKDTNNLRQPFAVSGQTTRAFSDRQIKKLLSGTVILDAAAVAALFEDGYGELLGISGFDYISQIETIYAYEELLEGNTQIYEGHFKPRIVAQRHSNEIIRMYPCENAQTASIVRRYDHQEIAPGMIVFHNSLGGTILLQAFPFSGRGARPDWDCFYFNVFRRLFIQHLLGKYASTKAELLFFDQTPISPYCVEFDNDQVLLAGFNITSDVIESCQCRLSEACLPDITSFKQLNDKGHWESISPHWVEQYNNEIKLNIPGNITPMSGVFIRFNKEG
jgi:hypothetical protein